MGPLQRCELLAALRELVATPGVSSPLVTAAVSRGPAVVLTSACLLGRPVTYRGAPARAAAVDAVQLLRRVAAAHPEVLRLEAVCPEAAVLGTPREAIRLVRREGDQPRVLTASNEDVTHRLVGHVEAAVRGGGHRADAASDGLITVRPSGTTADWIAVHAALLKRRSPSCGISDARLYSTESTADGFEKRPGIFAQRVMDANAVCVAAAAKANGSERPPFALVDEKSLGRFGRGDDARCAVVHEDGVAAFIAAALRLKAWAELRGGLPTG